LGWRSSRDASHSAAKDFVHMNGRGWTKRVSPMIDREAPLTLTFGAILRVGIPVSILWIIGDAIDGGSQSFIGVPLLVAAWLGAFVALDRWVSGQAIKTSGQRLGRRSAAK
jgi:hypothetical protein